MFKLAESVSRGAKLGFEFFEIPADGSHAWPRHFGREEKLNLTKLMADLGVSAEIISVDGSYNYGPNLCSEDKEIRDESLEYLKAVIEVGSDIGCSKFIMVPGRPLLDTPPQRAHALAVEGLQECADYAEKLGILVCVENRAFSTWLLDTPEKLQTMIEDASAKNIKVRLDPAHCNVAKVDFGRFCQSFRGRIASVGMHDNLGDRDAHLPLGQGNVDVGSAIRNLRTVRYDEGLTLEISPDETWGLHQTEELILESKAVLSRFALE